MNKKKQNKTNANAQHKNWHKMQTLQKQTIIDISKCATLSMTAQIRYSFWFVYFSFQLQTHRGHRSNVEKKKRNINRIVACHSVTVHITI